MSGSSQDAPAMDEEAGREAQPLLSVPRAGRRQSDPGQDAFFASHNSEMGRRLSLSRVPPGFKEFKPQDTIYGFIVIYPELHRAKSGSYCNLKVGLAILLVLVNIVLQVSLTMIAGSSIFDGMEAYKTSLTASPDQMTEYLRSINDNYLNVSMRIPGLIADDTQEPCCAGDECAGLGVPCCERKHPGSNRTSLVQHQKPAGKANKGKKQGTSEARRRALCLNADAGLDCTPPTYAYMDHWDDLDANRDGVWTSKEAEEDEANLGCKLGVPASEVFRAVAGGLHKYAHEISKTTPLPEVEKRIAVPYHYFNRWKGIATMCSAVDHNRCTALIQDGIFDGALKIARIAPRDRVTSLETALEYCQTMLMPGGVCDKAMPVTYIMYRQQVQDKCGIATFRHGATYTNPYDQSDVMRVVELSYPKLDKYTMAESPVFMFFLFLILLVWYVNLLGELGQIIHLADFTWNFPAAQDADPLHLQKITAKVARGATETLNQMFSQEVLSYEYNYTTPRGVCDDTPRIVDMSREHRVLCSIVVFLRLYLLIYMAQVGTVFTLSTYSYPDLLMNAVALAFVFELPEFLYTLLVGDDVKKEMEVTGSLYFLTSIPALTSGVVARVANPYFWGLIVFPFICILMITWHHYHMVLPIYEALNCACLQAGPRCVAELHLSQAWWNAWWGSLEPLF